MAEGSNLILQYQFMVRPLVAVRTSKILLFFQMENITVYMFYELAPQRLVHCNPTLSVIGKIFMPLLTHWKISLVFQARQIRPLANLVTAFYLFFIYSCMSRCLMLDMGQKVVTRTYV